MGQWLCYLVHMAELMSVRGYAKARGIAHTSVAYQIKKRGIPLVDGKIDAEYMDHVFREKVDAKQSLRGRGQQKLSGSAGLPGVSGLGGEPLRRLPTTPDAVGAGLPYDPVDIEAIRQRVPLDYNEAAYLQAVEELLKRRAANAESEGRLTATDKVTRAQFELARQVRDSMLGIVPRIQDELAAETDPAVCGRLLAAEIRLALESAARQAAVLTEDMDASTEDGDTGGDAGDAGAADSAHGVLL